MKRMLTGCLMLLASLAPSGAACADQGARQGKQDAAAIHAWRSTLADRLSEQGRADALFTAAWVMPWPGKLFERSHDADWHKAAQSNLKARLELLDRAAALAPDSATIAAASLNLCLHIDACESSPRTERLHAIDPDDGLYLLPALAKATEQGDGKTVTSILQTMSTAQRVHDSYGEALAIVHGSLGRLGSLPSPLPGSTLMRIVRESGCPDRQRCPLFGAGVFAGNLYTIEGMTSFSALGAACNPDAPARAIRQPACRRIGILLARNTALIPRLMGLALWQGAASDAADRAAAAGALRRERWINEQCARLTRSDVVSAFAFQQARFDLGSETAAMRALLEQHGIPLTPPADWRSQAERLEQPADSRDGSYAG